jgi:hypothetical protein
LVCAVWAMGSPFLKTQAVIASEAKQSGAGYARAARGDCFVAPLLAMTTMGL